MNRAFIAVPAILLSTYGTFVVSADAYAENAIGRIITIADPNVANPPLDVQPAQRFKQLRAVLESSGGTLSEGSNATPASTQAAMTNGGSTGQTAQPVQPAQTVNVRSLPNTAREKSTIMSAPLGVGQFDLSERMKP